MPELKTQGLKTPKVYYTDVSQTDRKNPRCPKKHRTLFNAYDCLLKRPDYFCGWALSPNSPDYPSYQHQISQDTLCALGLSEGSPRQRALLTRLKITGPTGDKIQPTNIKRSIYWVIHPVLHHAAQMHQVFTIPSPTIGWSVIGLDDYLKYRQIFDKLQEELVTRKHLTSQNQLDQLNPYLTPLPNLGKYSEFTKTSFKNMFYTYHLAEAMSQPVKRPGGQLPETDQQHLDQYSVDLQVKRLPKDWDQNLPPERWLNQGIYWSNTN